MKNLLIGLFCLGLTGLMHAQILETGNEIKLEAVTITSLNSTYLNAVRDKETPERVVNLENKVAKYDITEQPIFDNNFEAYEVVFKETDGHKGNIIATYDYNGKVLSTLERFKNVSLPPSVRNAVFKSYPDWTVAKDMYLVSYYGEDKVRKLYKVQIKKDNQKKNLKIDTKGQFL